MFYKHNPLVFEHLLFNVFSRTLKSHASVEHFLPWNPPQSKVLTPNTPQRFKKYSAKQKHLSFFSQVLWLYMQYIFCLIEHLIDLADILLLSPYPFSFHFVHLQLRFQECCRSETCHIQNFSDDAVRMWGGGREAEYWSLVNSFVNWCQCNHLQLNARKTKELLMDFQKTKSPPAPVTIQGENVEVVNTLCDESDGKGTSTDCRWRVRANSISWGGWGPLVSRAGCRELYMSLLYWVPSFMLLCAGRAAFQQRTLTDHYRGQLSPGGKPDTTEMVAEEEAGKDVSECQSWIIPPTHSKKTLHYKTLLN